MNLLGYPEAIYENDVKKIISNNMTIPEIIESFPIENQIPGKSRIEELFSIGIRLLGVSFFLQCKLFYSSSQGILGMKV